MDFVDLTEGEPDSPAQDVLDSDTYYLHSCLDLCMNTNGLKRRRQQADDVYGVHLDLQSLIVTLKQDSINDDDNIAGIYPQWMGRRYNLDNIRMLTEVSLKHAYQFKLRKVEKLHFLAAFNVSFLESKLPWCLIEMINDFL
jgi:hypothetical protein